MKKIHLSSIIIALMLGFSNCTDYLDFVPEKDILTIEGIFEKQITAEDFLISCYQSLQGSVATKNNPACYGADEFMTSNLLRNEGYKNIPRIEAFHIASGLQNVTSPILGIWGGEVGVFHEYPNRYWAIRNCNTYIENVDNVNDMTDIEKKRRKAEVKAIKAYYYLELIMHYGPIVLVPENVSISVKPSDMQFPRQHVDTCFNRVVKLFDEAIPYLNSIDAQAPNYKVIFTKEAAYAYRAKARLWQASPLFNGNEWYSDFKNREGQALFNTAEDPEKWKQAAKAIDEAVAYCEEVGRKLKDEVANQPTPMRNTIKNLHNSVFCENFTGREYIFGIWQISEAEAWARLVRYRSDHASHRGVIAGALNPPIRMVELFYTENGLPINSDKTWNYENRYKMGKEINAEYDGVVTLNQDVLNLHLRREPRFYANIGADGCYWVRGINSWTGVANNVLIEAYKGADHGVEDNRIVDSKPQNLTGYWAKKFCHDIYTGSGGTYNDPFVLMRLADLYLMQAEAHNEYTGPSQKVYDALDKVRSRAGIPGIQQAWMNYSNNPDKITEKTGLRDIIRQERMIEFAFEGHRFWDMRRWKTAHEEMNNPLKGWNVFGEEATSFYNNFEGPVVVYKGNKFEVPRDYFWPIRDEEAMVANIVQNPGW